MLKREKYCEFPFSKSRIIHILPHSNFKMSISYTRWKDEKDEWAGTEKRNWRLSRLFSGQNQTCTLASVIWNFVSSIHPAMSYFHAFSHAAALYLGFYSLDSIQTYSVNISLLVSGYSVILWHSLSTAALVHIL